MSECLTEEQIERLQGGDVTDAEESSMRAHLDACSACAEQASRTINRFDDLIQHIRNLDLSGTDLDQLHAGRRPRGEKAGAASDEPLPLPAASSFPGYEIIREIHHGGQGVVYQAIQQSTRRKVAIKVLLDGPYASRTARRRFEREIDLIAGLKHPNIVAIFDSGVTSDGRQFYVMDYVPGERLEQFVKAHRLTLHQALDLFARIADAVNYANLHGVIHRDLKPWNIVVDPEGNPKILDFGLAKTMVDKVDPLLSVSGQVVGTLPYMSPEQARGKSEEVDVRTDVYALGVILYEILTGQFPYPVQGDIAEVLHNITHAEPRAPSKAWQPNSGVALQSAPASRVRRRSCPLDDEIETIILKALAKERERRYQSAGDMARDVRHYLANEPLDAKRDSSWYLIRKTVRRHKLAMGVGAFFVLVVTASAIALTFMYRDASRERLRAEAEARNAQHERDRALAAETLARQRFDQLRDLANSFIFEFHDKIVTLAGSLPARQLLVTKAQAYLSGLSASSEADPSLTREIAAAYLKVGDVQCGAAFPNIGDSQGALESYEAAIRKFESAMAADPSGAQEDRRNIAIIQTRVGDMYRIQSPPEKALEFYQKAQATFEALIQNKPDDLVAQHDTAVAYSRTGEMLFEMGRPTEGMRILNRAKDVCESLVQKEPEKIRWKHALAIALAKIADATAASGENAAAIAASEQVISLANEILKAQPENAWARRSLGIGHDTLGRVFLAEGRTDKAVGHYEASMKLSEQIAALDNQDARAQRDVYISGSGLAMIYSELNRIDEAIALYKKSLEIAEELSAADPASSLGLLDIAVVAGNYGALLIQQGKPADAIPILKRSMDINTTLLERDPNSPKISRNLGISFQSIGHAQADLARAASTSDADRKQAFETAIDYYERAFEAFERCKSRGFLHENEMSIFDAIKTDIADCRAQLASLTDTQAASRPADH